MGIQNGIVRCTQGNTNHTAGVKSRHTQSISYTFLFIDGVLIFDVIFLKIKNIKNKKHVANHQNPLGRA